MKSNKNNTFDGSIGREYSQVDNESYYGPDYRGYIPDSSQQLYDYPEEDFDNEPIDYTNTEEFLENKYKKDTYVELRKYVPTIFFIAICFVLYALGLAGKILDLITLLLFLVVVYTLVSVFIFKKTFPEVVGDLKGIWTLSEGAFKSATKGFNDASQHVYDKYIVDDLKGDITKNNSYKGANVDSFHHMSDDLAREAASGNASDKLNPEYAKNVTLENKDLYNRYKENQYYESIENLDIESDYKKDKENKLNYKQDKNIYKMDNEAQNYEESDIDYNNLELTDSISVSDNEKLVIFNKQMSINHNYNPDKYITKNEKLIDIEVIPLIMSENVKLVNENDELKVYYGDMKFRGSNENVIFQIKLGSKTYRLQCKNIEYLEVDGPMDISITF